jgi:hypothetical protein
MQADAGAKKPDRREEEEGVALRGGHTMVESVVP